MRILAILSLLVAALHAQEELVCRVSYVAADGVYVDAGRKQGVAVGNEGRILKQGVEVARVQVVAVSASSARLTVVSQTAAPAAGDRVQLLVDARPADTPEPEAKKKKSDEFVPLLEKQGGRAKISSKKNIAHGYVSVRQLVQTGLTDYWTTIVGSGGSIERLGGAPWTLRWSGNASARGGDGFDESTLEGARLDLYELSLTRRLNEAGSLVRFGRFLPHQLVGTGYIDGVQGEFVLSDTLRVGGIAGFKPTRDELTPTADEPTFAAYATVAGKRYTATFGVLAGLFDDELDRLALLVDQRFEVSERFTIQSSLEVDFDVDAAMFREEGVRLTRFDVLLTIKLTQSTRLRGGADHWERLDNAAERDVIGAAVDATYFDRGTWRYFAGLRQVLPWKLEINVEVARLSSPDTDDTPHVTLGITRREVFGIEYSSLTVTLYNLEGSGTDGLGGIVSAYLPFNRWIVLPSLGFRALEAENTDLDVTDVRVRVEYRHSAKWSFSGSVSHLMADDGIDSTQFEFGLRYRW